MSILHKNNNLYENSQIKKVSFEGNNTIFFEGSKYRASDGGFGVEVIIHYKDNKWKFKEVKMTWIS